MDAPLGRREALRSAGAAGAAVLAGCLAMGERGSRTAPAPTETELSGTITAAGSSTVYPITVAVGNRFVNRHPEVSVRVSSTGTGGGFSDFFCRGRTELNDASRPISADEASSCRDRGVEFVAFQIATDALTIMTNLEATWVDCVTPSELAAIWRTGGAERWSDVRSSWPDEPIELHGPSSASGTFDYFAEAILGEDASHRTDHRGTEQDETIVKEVEKSRLAMGYLGFAYYVRNRDAVEALAIDAGDGCVRPSVETAEDGSYAPLSRPLFLYVAERALRRRVVREFCRYYLRNANDVAADIGYVPVSESTVEANLRRFEDAVADAGEA